MPLMAIRPRVGLVVCFLTCKPNECENFRSGLMGGGIGSGVAEWSDHPKIM